MLVAAEKLAPPPGRTWWAEEMAWLLASAANLPPGPREAVQNVLRSLLRDRELDAAALRDVRVLLAALDRPA